MIGMIVTKFPPKPKQVGRLLVWYNCQNHNKFWSFICQSSSVCLLAEVQYVCWQKTKKGVQKSNCLATVGFVGLWSPLSPVAHTSGGSGRTERLNTGLTPARKFLWAPIGLLESSSTPSPSLFTRKKTSGGTSESGARNCCHLVSTFQKWTSETLLSFVFFLILVLVLMSK